MVLNLATLGVSALAGALSTLSPCVLPLIPILMGSAANAHRWGAYALVVGLALSFALFGFALAAFGTVAGLSDENLRRVGAVMLIVFGLALVVSPLQSAMAKALGSVSDRGTRLLERTTLSGLGGQFMLGTILGVVWSPCVGPTLGAAASLASQGQQLGDVALLMLMFGIGAGAPLILIGSLSKSALSRGRGKLLAMGVFGKQLLGVVMTAIGAIILIGWDHPMEAWLLDHSPAWLTTLTTRF